MVAVNLLNNNATQRCLWGCAVLVLLMAFVGCGMDSDKSKNTAKEGGVALGPMIPVPPIKPDLLITQGLSLDGESGLSALDQAWLADDTERFQAAVNQALDLKIFPSDESVELIVWEDAISRGEFAFWTMGFSGQPTAKHLLKTYEDVEVESPYYSVIEDVTERGWMQGQLEGPMQRFYPEQPLTREQLAQALVVMARKIPAWQALINQPKAEVADSSSTSESELLPVTLKDIPDSAQIGDAYRSYVVAAVNAPWFSVLFQQYPDDVTSQGFSPKQPVPKDLALMALYGVTHPPSSQSGVSKQQE